MKAIIKILFFLFLIGCNKTFTEKIASNNISNSISSQPNIILILVDDFGYEIPNYTGGTSWQTPNIDALAARSVRFSYCNVMPLCSPTRIELITGQYNFRNYTDWGLLNMNDVCIAERLKDVGYKTCAAGKWQMNNGDAGLKAAGFDNYMIWQAFVPTGAREGNKFKSPGVYTQGDWLPDSVTEGKYGEDYFRNYVFDFIDSNKNNPFYVYWAPNLTHSPYQPTPDDPEFANFVAGEQNSDIVWFGSNVRYLDKQIGMLMDKLDTIPNTLVIFLGDNGTEAQITSIQNGITIRGGKSHTYNYGTHVPLLTYWSGVTTPHDDSSLIDASDFFKTITEAGGANTSSPDGTSFLPQIKGLTVSQKKWLYFWYKYNSSATLEVWAKDRITSKYDSVGVHNGAYYNYVSQPLEKHQLLVNTVSRIKRANYFQHIIDSLK